MKSAKFSLNDIVVYANGGSEPRLYTVRGVRRSGRGYVYTIGGDYNSRIGAAGPTHEARESVLRASSNISDNLLHRVANPDAEMRASLEAERRRTLRSER